MPTKVVEIALVKGDGSAPEMMAAACAVANKAVEKDGIVLKFIETPMGWNAYNNEPDPKKKDTLPKKSHKLAVKIPYVFFGGVGDPQFDNTIGKERPEMKPEAHCLLPLRSDKVLLLNVRPMTYRKVLGHKENALQIYVRFLLEDSYFGNSDLRLLVPRSVRRRLGIKLKKDVKETDKIIVDIAYYRRDTVEKYARAVFAYAKSLGLPVVSIDKANVMARYDLWRKIFTKIGKEEFPDVPLSHQLVDSANALLTTPEKLFGVIACGNEHGDILSDGAAAIMGGMGLMQSSSINPDTGAALFESGAGTAPTLAGLNKANPLGRILTAAMMLRHIGAVNGAQAIESSVQYCLEMGYRTGDMVTAETDPAKILGTKEMGDMVIAHLDDLNEK